MRVFERQDSYSHTIIQYDWLYVVIVRKTVAINPIMDDYIRQTWAIMIERGYDFSYSSALNHMLLTSILLVGNQGIDDESAKTLRGFLTDTKTIKELNLEDYLNAIRELTKTEIDDAIGV